VRRYYRCVPRHAPSQSETNAAPLGTLSNRSQGNKCCWVGLRSFMGPPENGELLITSMTLSGLFTATQEKKEKRSLVTSEIEKDPDEPSSSSSSQVTFEHYALCNFRSLLRNRVKFKFSRCFCGFLGRQKKKRKNRKARCKIQFPKALPLLSSEGKQQHVQMRHQEFRWRRVSVATGNALQRVSVSRWDAAKHHDMTRWRLYI